MSSNSARLWARAAAAVAALALTATMAPVDAKPAVRPGKVTNLVASVTKPAASYQLASTWTASTNTTSYRVRAVDGTGAVLDSDTVVQPAWTAVVAASAGTTVRVSVTPYNGTRRGVTASLDKMLPDLTAPVGVYAGTVSGVTGTITETSLTDDVSAAAAVSRLVDWGDGTVPQQWLSGTEITHDYAAVEARYTPTVTLTDEAANTVVVPVNALVVMDTQGPTGTYTAAPAAAWTAWTKVVLTQGADFGDNWSPDATISREVSWGDGTAPQAWTAGLTLPHVYRVAGTFTPTVTAVDEAGNVSVLSGTAVTVTTDRVAPVVKLRLPRVRKASVRSWKVLRGTLTDAGTGARLVQVKAIEKRLGVWHAYKPGTRTWVKATSKRAAWRKAGVLRARPDTSHVWRAPLAKLKRGTLAYRVIGVDNVGNRSRPVVHAQRLTRR